MTRHASARELKFQDHSPVYRQIALILREKIGVTWKPGDELPSENEMASSFGVNRNTLRRAIGLLVDEGLLERRRGVNLRITRLPLPARPKLEAHPANLFRMRPGTSFKVLSFERQPAPPEAVENLRLAPGSDCYRIDRLLLSGQEVLAYLIVYATLTIGDQLHQRDLTSTPITAIVYETLKVPTRRVRQTVEATLADATVASVLSMSPGAAALKCGYIFMDSAEAPMFMATYFYCGDRVRLALDIEIDPSPDIDAKHRLEAWPLTVTSLPNNAPPGARRPPRPAKLRKSRPR